MSDTIQYIDELNHKADSELKNFQIATVNRVDALFSHQHNRVLVADEVGLGKTKIAEGVIARMARLRYNEGDDLFKVVYVCSNQNIANQNIRDINKFLGVETWDNNDTRLSMQHLAITKKELSASEDKRFIDAISLTPETSFRMTSGAGSSRERALMYSILSRIPELQPYLEKLDQMLWYFKGRENWKYDKQDLEGEVERCNKKSEGKYPADVIEKLPRQLISNLITHLQSRPLIAYSKERNKIEYICKGDTNIIVAFRKAFAKISVDMLNADLVIMDEFQRFKFLLSDDDIEMKALTDAFLNVSYDNSDKSRLVRVLLLSATPYKIYSTSEEIEENKGDDVPEEFLDVIKFLKDSTQATESFKNVWEDYSISLHELQSNEISVLSLQNKKEVVEQSMYDNICRTERISVMDSGDYIDDKSKGNPVNVMESDIRSYLDSRKAMDGMEGHLSLPLEYVKSCAYPLSYMDNYQAKKKMTEWLKEYRKSLHAKYGNEGDKKLESLMDLSLQSKQLWVNKDGMQSYKPLPKINARLERLRQSIFQNHSELYLWVPPSRPYYQMQGVYKNSEGFSKILVFSSWEMVPKMIATLISYDAEQKTVGFLCNQQREAGKTGTSYDYDSKGRRYPSQRLAFSAKTMNDSENTKRLRMALLSLIYPSKTLAGMFNVVEWLNMHDNSLADLQNEIKAKIEKELGYVKSKYQKTDDGRVDNNWYYLFGMLADGENETLSWIDETLADIQEKERRNEGLEKHLEELRNSFNQGIELGREPSDLINVLVNIVLGSPAVCLMRNIGITKRATELGLTFLSYFNKTESTAAVEMAYRRRKDDESHWKDVLHYCKDGCFQAMIDEYFHMVTGGKGFPSAVDSSGTTDRLFADIRESLELQTSSYNVENYRIYKNNILGRDSRNTFGIRSHYAVCFAKGKAEDSTSINRKDSLQKAFNSPLRPFVLASTSIGQEGLDFHFYCRKIMHWNLPSNPVDMEQREGRVNRYKCLAVRQDIAKKYGYGKIEFKKDIWKEMFQAAENEKPKEESDLIPYWCLGKDQEVKIERILPLYPLSKDTVNYERLIKVLSLYRLTLGQARQEELLEYIFSNFDSRQQKELKSMFINLSPFSKEH